jgi:hypothetical protein
LARKFENKNWNTVAVGVNPGEFNLLIKIYKF